MSKQVMQRALDAFEHHVAQTRPIERTSRAIEELRAAIAAPEVEPVAWARLRADGRAPDVVWQETAPDESHELALYCEPPDTEAVRKELEHAKFSYMDGYEGGKQEARDAAHEELGKLTHQLEQIKAEKDSLSQKLEGKRLCCIYCGKWEEYCDCGPKTL